MYIVQLLTCTYFTDREKSPGEVWLLRTRKAPLVDSFNNSCSAFSREILPAYHLMGGAMGVVINKAINYYINKNSFARMSGNKLFAVYTVLEEACAQTCQYKVTGRNLC